MKKHWCIVLFLLLLCLWIDGIKAEANTMEGAAISMSPDGNAFTTNAGETDTKWYEKDYEVRTGISGKLRTPKIGEHLFSAERTDTVPISKWVVSLERAKCIHNYYPEGNLFHGVSFEKQKCLSPYYSGWFAYCADCNEQVVNYYFYMSEEVAKSIKYLDMSKSYFYLCPHCTNLEQGVALSSHICREISMNRYFVRYHANLGSGHMEKSTHMVNNSTIYEGREVTPQTKLNLNAFTRKGYEFVGWNTQKDGSGTAFSDGETIYNLSMEENDSVILYAQWKKSSSVLEIDSNGGSYDSKKGIQKIVGEYGSEYQVNPNLLTAPDGYRVHFDAMGGEHVPDIVGKQVFKEWACSQPFYGKFAEDKYSFLGTNGMVDRLTALYTMQPILLPNAVRKGYSFGGWFEDKECTIPIGGAGSQWVPGKEMTLYAGWVDLQLSSKDNYLVNQGKGAVDLTWLQKDNQSKVYEVYQKTDESEWIKISSIEEKAEQFAVTKTVHFSEQSGSYTVPYTGFYDLTLTGAQGESYGSYCGGKGGQVEVTVYLLKGEKLEYTIGGQNGYMGGGIGTEYGNGGGYSILSTKRLGTIMIAGGGGGASPIGDGGVGGSSEQVDKTSNNGQDGAVGGGGGHFGGVSGDVQIHQHIQQCRHRHSGNPNTYGGCYTSAIVCGSQEIEFKVTNTVFYYGNIADDGSHQYCVRCASDDCPGHLNEYGAYVCKICSNQTNTNVTECAAISSYGLSCEKDENYICGKMEGEVIRAKSAYGGSNYINLEAIIRYQEVAGVQEGNGNLRIVSNQIGLIEANEMKGVPASDVVAPGAIDEKSVKLTAVKEDEIRVAFDRPIDNGTGYYHQVKSYDKETMEFICESNVTKNVLVSQVVGYYYVVDKKRGTVVTTANKYYAEKGEKPFLILKATDEVQYLHIAAVDKAGNLAPTVHIKISLEETIYWPLLTEKLLIGMDQNVSLSQVNDTYYVKADDSTPIEISLEGMLCGTARKGYQINVGEFVVSNMSDSQSKGEFAVIVPNRDSITVGTYTYSADKLQKKVTGICGIQDASHSTAKRADFCRNLQVIQKFIVPQSMDGQMIQIMPRVTAIGEKEAVTSKEESDLINCIYLIADGKGPSISGMAELDNMDTIEYESGKALEVELAAEDTGSGLAEFYVEVRNQENGITEVYVDGELDGRIKLCIQESEPVFNGKFSVMVYAVDKVGNVSSVQNELLGIGLEAYVERVLEPHTPVFKKGESGKLYINTWGYVERLEICFPAPFVEDDETLNRTIVYENPNAFQTEEVPFMVPLFVEDGEMTISVRAYKDGTELDREPQVIVIEVKGTVLDEIRTRLR